MVVKAKVCGPWSVELEFDDGLRRRVNLKLLRKGPLFRPLLAPVEFVRLCVDRGAGTIVWPNDADIAPEALDTLPAERAA